MQVKAGQRLWKSKYALTGGIEEVIACDDQGDDGYIRLKDNAWNLFVVGRDVHATREEAAVAAEAMRKKKIASLQKQIKKLEALTF